VDSDWRRQRRRLRYRDVRFAGETVHVEKLLTGSQRTIILPENTVVSWISACTATFRAGAWQIAARSGAYERLTGGRALPRRPQATATSAPAKST